MTPYQQWVHPFQTGEFTRETWNHEAHLVVALYYCMQYGAQAYTKIKPAIIRLNQSLGIPNTRDSGYHDTLTQFWIEQIVAFFRWRPAKAGCHRINGVRLRRGKYSLNKVLSGLFWGKILL